MPRAVWPLHRGRPQVSVVLTSAATGQPIRRTLLADTGAGSDTVGFDLLLTEQDCLTAGGRPIPPVILGGTVLLTIPQVRDWLADCEAFAIAFDAVTRNHLQTTTGLSPWLP